MNMTDTVRGAVLLLTLGVASVAGASVGKVIVSVGQVEGVTPTGDVRELKRRSQVFKTDTVKTYQSARTQLRFSDGSMLSLGENSLFKVEEYEFGTGNPEKAVYHLLKGSMQTITGAIGRVNKKDYSLKTPVATIGIRGTYYQLQLTPSGGLIGGVKDGAIVVKNRKGTVQKITAGEFFQMASADGEITVLDEPPQGLNVLGSPAARSVGGGDVRQSPSLQEQGAVGGINASGEGDSGVVTVPGDSDGAAGSGLGDSETLEILDDDNGESAVPGVNTAPGSLDENAGGSPAAAQGQNNGTLPGSGDNRLPLTPTGALAPAGRPVQLAFIQTNAAGALETSTDAFVTDPGHQVYLSNVGGVGNVPTYIEVMDLTSGNCNVCQFSSGSAVLVEDGGNAVVGGGVNWGRWNGGLIVGENGVALPAVGPDFHYIHSDVLTPYSQLAALSGTFNYASLGGTSPTDSEGNVGTLMNMNIDVDFTAMQFTYVNMQLNVGGTAYSGNLVSPTAISPALSTELVLDNGRMNAQFVGVGASTGTELGITTSYELQDPGSGKSAVGTNYLVGY